MAAGFWDFLFEILLGVGKVATSLNEEAEKRMEKIQKDYDRSVQSFERRYTNCSDQQLKARVNNSSASSAEKRACVNLLNERKQNGKE